MTYLLGMGQMLVEGGEPQRNLARARQTIFQAKERSCKIVVLPECLDLGWTHPAARKKAQPIPGPHSDAICLAARQAGVYVTAGLVERAGGRLLLSPCAWAVDADHNNTNEPYGALWIGSYTTLAKLHEMTVAGVSNVGWLTAGPWQGRKCIGCSLAVGPGGEILAQGPYGEAAEALLVVEVGTHSTGSATR